MKYKPIAGHENDIDPKDLENPFKNRKYGWVLKFIISTLFGGFVSAAIFLVFMCASVRGHFVEEFWSSKYLHAFWIVPLAWGFLGIFLFETMLNTARDLVEGFGSN